MKVTINPLKTEQYELVIWPVNDEPSRLSLDTDKFSYQLISTEQGPLLEVYEVANGEVGNFIRGIELPK